MIKFDNSYTQLPEIFFSASQPAKFSSPQLCAFNHELAQELGLQLESLSPTDLAAYFSGQKIFSGAALISTVYSGHQFGHPNVQLGDGRALLLGEIVAPSGRRFDLQLKGAGPTPYSRRGDGLSALGPVLREYLMSEAMHELGVPTTRALAAVKTHELVERERLLPGGVFTRVASSHIRFGTFEFFAQRRDVANLRVLFEYVLQRHYPELLTVPNPALSFFEAVGLRILRLVSVWMRLGFIHGVMNTDNMSICGETIDYGPCAFMQNFRNHQHFSSIDQRGRYRYSAQGDIALWNLSILARCLVPLVAPEESQAISLLQIKLNELAEQFQIFWLQEMSSKFGIASGNPETEEIINEYLQYLERHQIDFTAGFLQLEQWIEKADLVPTDLKVWMQKLEKFWIEEKTQRPLDLMQTRNPRRIPRNELIELAIAGAYENDLTHFQALPQVFKKPFVEKEIPEIYQYEPGRVNPSHKTFCGT